MSKIEFHNRVHPRLEQTGEQGTAVLCLSRTNLTDDLYGVSGASGFYVFQVELQGRYGLGSVGGCVDEYHLLMRPNHPTAFCHIDCC